MGKTTTTTTVEYPIDEFIDLVRDRIFNRKCGDIQFFIQEVGGDPLDRFPGRPEVTTVRVKFDGIPKLPNESGLLEACRKLVFANRSEHMITRLNDEETAAYEQIKKIVMDQTTREKE